MYLLCEIMFLLLSWILPVCIFFLNSWSYFTLCCSLSVLLFFEMDLFYYRLFLTPLSCDLIIVFTAVNFDLVLFFFQFFIWSSLPWLLRLGAPLWLWLWFWGWSCHPGSFPHCSFYSSLTFAAHPLSPAHCPSVWHVHLLMLLWCLHMTHSAPTLPHDFCPYNDPPPYCPLPPYHQPGPFPSSFATGYSSPPSLRAAKVAKAAAVVANSSSSPVKELRDLSAMDAFRSRSISVSEHAVRRLEKSLLGNQTINNNLNTCFLIHGMVGGV